MTTYYVATLAHYVLVEANDEPQARDLGLAALQRQFASRPFEIRTVRPANKAELELEQWRDALAAAETSQDNPHD